MRPIRSPCPAGDPALSVVTHRPWTSWLLRYSGVAASVALAAVLRVPLRPVLGDRDPYVTLFPAVVYSAWAAGWTGGLLATVLSAIVAADFLLPRAASLRVSDPADQISLILFVMISAGITVLGQTRHHAQWRADTSGIEAARSLQRAEQSTVEKGESDARKAAILEAALDCIITIDDRESVIEWNPAAERTFGFSRAEAVGQRLSGLIIPPRLRAEHALGLAHFLATGEGPILNRRIEVSAFHAGGAEFPVELTVTPIRLGERTLFTAYLRDLTERERSASQQRVFLRDVLRSVTDGRLHLCHTAAELPASLPPQGEPIRLATTGEIGELRCEAQRAAAAQEFPAERQHDRLTATSEAAMNAVVHAGGGVGRVCGSGDTIQVWVEDQGQGIDVARLPRAALETRLQLSGHPGPRHEADAPDHRPTVPPNESFGNHSSSGTGPRRLRSRLAPISGAGEGQQKSGHLRMFEVKPLRMHQWPLLKAVRLKALADVPEAFSTTLAQAQAWSDADWQERARRFDAAPTARSSPSMPAMPGWASGAAIKLFLDCRAAPF